LADLTRDPYVYARNNPSEWVDPTGLLSWSQVGHWATEHSGQLLGGATAIACIAVSAGGCAVVVVTATVTNGLTILATKPGDEVLPDEGLNLVGGIVGGVVPGSLAMKGAEELIPIGLRPVIDYLTGVPAGVYGFLDPHVDECGYLESALRPSQ
jgi:hypothetical protein